MRIKIEEIEGLLRQAFKKRGVEDYEVLIDHFIEAELRGFLSRATKSNSVIKGVGFRYNQTEN